MEELVKHFAWFKTWQQTPSYAQFKARPIAYFCSEFALETHIPTYSGGLGILAGDVIREAADRDVPLVGVGLYYQHGYICPTKLIDGELVEACVDFPPESVGLKPVLLSDGTRLKLKVPIQDVQVEVQAWEWSRAGVKVYLLDTELESNSAGDRRITDRLYIAHSETRLKQQIILGLGGLSLLEALKVHT